LYKKREGEKHIKSRNRSEMMGGKKRKQTQGLRMRKAVVSKREEYPAGVLP
jgi:hypothetical protein